MIPISPIYTAIQQIYARDLHQGVGGLDLDDYIIWGVKQNESVLRLDPQSIQNGLPPEITSLILINEKGGKIEKSFSKSISHATDNLKLKMVFRYEISIEPSSLNGFLSFLTEYGEKYRWNLEKILERIVLDPVEEFLVAKEAYGFDLFDSLLDLKADARQHTLDTLKLKLNQEIVLSITVEGEDKIEDWRIVEASIPLYYEEEKTLQPATLSATLSIDPSKKARAVALHDKAMVIREKTIAKINDFFQQQGDLKVLMEKEFSDFQEELLGRVNQFLAYLGRHCTDFSLSLPFELPVRKWTDKQEITINSFVDGEEHTVYVSFSAELKNFQKAVQHPENLQATVFNNHIKEYASSAWKDRSMQSILLNHEYQEKEMEVFISPRLEEMGYKLTHFSLQFDTYLPKKEERLLVEWETNYLLRGGKISLPVKVQMDGRVRDLTPWEGIITKDFNMPQWLRQSFDSDFQQHIRLEPSTYGMFGDEEKAYRELSEKLKNLLQTKCQDLGIEIRHLNLEIGESPAIALVEELQAGLQSFALQGIKGEK